MAHDDHSRFWWALPVRPTRCHRPVRARPEHALGFRLVVAALACCLPACEARLSLGGACTRSSECAAPLVCASRRCRVECVNHRDCALAARCLFDADGAGRCVLPDDPACDATSCAAGQACVDGACFETCTTSCAADGVCESGGCVRPPEGGDAGPTDAGAPVDAPCSWSWSASNNGTILVAGTSHVALATSETGSAGAMRGWVHAGVVGAVPPSTSPSAHVFTVPAASLDATPSAVDLSVEAFFATSPRSIGLARRPDGAVGVFAIFDGSAGSSSPDAIRGGAGRIQPGAVAWGDGSTVLHDGWFCSESSGLDCTDPPARVATLFGRALVTGGRDPGSPVRYVYRYSVDGGPLSFASTRDDFGEDHSTMLGVPPGAFIDIAGSTGDRVAFVDPATSRLYSWRTGGDAAPEAIGLLSSTPMTRIAFEHLGGFAYLLANGWEGAVIVRGLTCSATCTVHLSPSAGFYPDAGSEYLFPALAQTPLGIAVAYTERTAAGDQVVAQVLEAADLSMFGVVRGSIGLLGLPAGRRVIDVQLAVAPAESGGRPGDFELVAAVLSGPEGSSSGDQLHLAGTRFTTACP